MVEALVSSVPLIARRMVVVWPWVSRLTMKIFAPTSGGLLIEPAVGVEEPPMIGGPEFRLSKLQEARTVSPATAGGRVPWVIDPMLGRQQGVEATATSAIHACWY